MAAIEPPYADNHPEKIPGGFVPSLG